MKRKHKFALNENDFINYKQKDKLVFGNNYNLQENTG